MEPIPKPKPKPKAILSKAQSQESQQSRISIRESKLCIISDTIFPYKKGQLILAKWEIDSENYSVSSLTDITIIRKIPNSYVSELLPRMVEEYLLSDKDYFEKIMSKLIEPDMKELIELATEQLPLLFDPDLIPRCRERMIQLTVKIGKNDILEFLFAMWRNEIDFSQIVDSEGNTLLHLATLESNTDSFTTLLELAKDFGDFKGKARKGSFTLIGYINKFNNAQHTALHIAVISRFSLAIEKLIKQGADITLTDNENSTIVHIAAALNNTKSLKKILEVMDSNDKDGKFKWKYELQRKNGRGFIPVMLATDKTTIMTLLDDYTPTEPVHEEHGYLLHWAVANNRTNLVQLLLKDKIDLQLENEKGNTALKIATRWGYRILTDELLKAGADPNFVGSSGVTCINNACQYGFSDVLELLLQYKTELDSDEMEFSALHSAIQGGQVEIARFLLETHQMDPNLIKSKGTPLHEAIQNGHAPCVKLLLKHGANPQLSFDIQGYRPLHAAIKNNQRQAVKLLLEFGAAADDAMYGGVTPAILAAQYDHSNILALLLAEGINLSKTDDAGNTLLHHIAMHQACNCAEYLVSQFSDRESNWEYSIYETRNFKDLTPIDIALSKQDERILTHFISFTPRDFFNQYPKIVHQLYDSKYYSIVRIIMSKMIIIDSPNYILSTQFLESNSFGQYPEDPNFSHLEPTLLHKLRDCPDPEIKYHPILNIVVTEKLKLYNWWYILSFVVYVVFLVCLYYALIQASYLCENLLLYPNGINSPTDIARFSCEIYVMLHGFLFALSEIFEFVIEWHHTFKEKKFQHKLKSKLHIEKTFLHRKQMSDKVGEGIRHIFLNAQANVQAIDRHTLYFFSSFISFYDAYNIFDSLAILSLIGTIICRAIQVRFQWTFASLSFVFFSLSLFKYTRIFPALGAYVQTIFRIYTIDIPRYASIVIIFLVAFYGSMHLAARQRSHIGSTQPFTSGCPNVTDPYQLFSWFPSKHFGQNLEYDNRLPLIAGLIFLLDGGPSEYQEDILYPNALLIVIYLLFAFTIIVVMSNVLIAQLTQTYAAIIKTDRFHYKIELVVTFELKSNLAFVFGKKARRLAAFDQMVVPLNLWNIIREESPEKESDIKINEILSKIETDSTKIHQNSNKLFRMEEKFDELNTQLHDMSENLVLIKNSFQRSDSQPKPDASKILTRLPTTREGNIGSRMENIEQKLERILLRLEPLK